MSTGGPSSLIEGTASALEFVTGKTSQAIQGRIKGHDNQPKVYPKEGNRYQIVIDWDRKEETESGNTNETSSVIARGIEIPSVPPSRRLRKHHQVASPKHQLPKNLQRLSDTDQHPSDRNHHLYYAHHPDSLAQVPYVTS